MYQQPRTLNTPLTAKIAIVVGIPSLAPLNSSPNRTLAGIPHAGTRTKPFSKRNGPPLASLKRILKLSLAQMGCNTLITEAADTVKVEKPHRQIQNPQQPDPVRLLSSVCAHMDKRETFNALTLVTLHCFGSS
jgi:hypothetical protein